MTVGAGGSPAGSSISGYGVGSVANVPSDAALPDQTTNLPTTCRLLVPSGAQGASYAFSADGRLVGCGTVRQLVQLALSTVLGSCCVPGLGLAYYTLKEQGANFQRQVATAVANAMAPLVKQRLVALLSVDLQQYPSNPDSGIALVTWRDLTTGQQDTSSIGP